MLAKVHHVEATREAERIAEVYLLVHRVSPALLLRAAERLQDTMRDVVRHVLV